MRPTARGQRASRSRAAAAVVARREVRRRRALPGVERAWAQLSSSRTRLLGAEGHEHDETSSGQEEVNVVVRGGGHWRVDGEEVPVREGTVRSASTPRPSRCPVAGPERDDVRRDRRTPRRLRAAGPVLIARILIWNLFDSKTTLDGAARAPARAAGGRRLDRERGAGPLRADLVRRRAARPRRDAGADRRGAGGRRRVRRRVSRVDRGTWAAAAARPPSCSRSRSTSLIALARARPALGRRPIYEHYATLVRGGARPVPRLRASSTRPPRCRPCSCAAYMSWSYATSFAVLMGALRRRLHRAARLGAAQRRRRAVRTHLGGAAR